MERERNGWIKCIIFFSLLSWPQHLRAPFFFLLIHNNHTHTYIYVKIYSTARKIFLFSTHSSFCVSVAFSHDYPSICACHWYKCSMCVFRSVCVAIHPSFKFTFWRYFFFYDFVIWESFAGKNIYLFCCIY